MTLDLEKMNLAFPIIIRYTGLVTTLVLIGFCLAGYTIQAAPGFVAASGMILYKSVYDSAQSNMDKNGEK